MRYQGKMEHGPVYERGPGKRGCLMLGLRPLGWEQLQALVPDRDLYDDETKKFGRENEPHLTLLYGFDPEVLSQDVLDAASEAISDLPGNLIIRTTGISAFECEGYDVLKLTVQLTPELAAIRKRLEKFPHKSSYPVYQPHVTIAYTKPGRADSLCRDFFSAVEMWPNQLHYSGPIGHLYKELYPRRLPTLRQFQPVFQF